MSGNHHDLIVDIETSQATGAAKIEAVQKMIKRRAATEESKIGRINVQPYNDFGEKFVFMRRYTLR